MPRIAFAVLAGLAALALVCEVVALVWRFCLALVRDLNPWRHPAPRNRGERRAAARRKGRR